MYKLYKKDGTEVQFSTEEGMLKTLKAFPDKYCSIKNFSNEEITEKEIEDLQIEKVEDEISEED